MCVCCLVATSSASDAALLLHRLQAFVRLQLTVAQTPTCPSDRPPSLSTPARPTRAPSPYASRLSPTHRRRWHYSSTPERSSDDSSDILYPAAPVRTPTSPRYPQMPGYVDSAETYASMFESDDGRRTVRLAPRPQLRIANAP